jgi:hypothetical protein
VPACAAAGMTVHFVGSIDYALDCAPGGNWAVALNLTHLCGDMAHGAWSSKPTGTANHPDRLFAIVAPAPFNYANTAPLPLTPMTGDAVRSTQANLGSGTWIQHSEQFVGGGQLSLVNNDCACSNMAGAPPRWGRYNLRYDYGCFFPPNTSLQSIAWPPIAPTGFNVFPLGMYANPGAYPGNAFVSVCFGVASAPDVCGFNLPVHLLHGVATHGSLAMFFNTVLPPSFDLLDVENMYVINFNGPLSMALGYGAFFLSTMVWSGNF